MFSKRVLGLGFAAAVALGCLLVTVGAQAQCRVDWNGDGEVTESDYLQGTPIGGFYAEWYIYQYYPSYYPILFPTGNTAGLDYDGSGTIDEADLMGPLDAVLQSEGFYVEWYIYMFYAAYYPIFMAESTCPPLGVRESVALTSPVYRDVNGVQFSKISRDGSLIGGTSTDTFYGFVVPTADVIADPLSSATYEYLGTQQVNRIEGFSNDMNIVIANVPTQVDGVNVNAGAYYNRTTGVWTILPEPEEGVNWASCRFYPKAGGVSADGALIVGATAMVAHPCRYRAFVFDTIAEEYTLMPYVEAGKGQDVLGCDAEVTRLVGYEERSAEVVDGEVIHFGGRVPMVWTLQSDGTWMAERLSEDATGQVYDISYNGDYYAGSDRMNAYLWTDSGSTNIGSLDSLGPAKVFGLSDDGKFGVGSHEVGLGWVAPFVWRPGVGMERIEDYLAAQGAPVGVNWNENMFVPRDVSSDGKVIIGLAGGIDFHYGFLAVVN